MRHDLCSVLDDASSGGELVEHDVDEGHGLLRRRTFLGALSVHQPLCWGQAANDACDVRALEVPKAFRVPIDRIGPIRLSCAFCGCLCLAHINDLPDPQSPWFYRFAILTLLWGAAVGAYGLFVFDVNP
jgi:hypothetical protein